VLWLASSLKVRGQKCCGIVLGRPGAAGALEAARSAMTGFGVGQLVCFGMTMQAVVMMGCLSVLPRVVLARAPGSLDDAVPPVRDHTQARDGWGQSVNVVVAMVGETEIDSSRCSGWQYRRAPSGPAHLVLWT
jgi:hypothetical protein